MNDFNLRLSVDPEGNITVADDLIGEVTTTSSADIFESGGVNFQIKRDGKKTTIIIEEPDNDPRLAAKTNEHKTGGKKTTIIIEEPDNDPRSAPMMNKTKANGRF